jgi:hypothetical protein
MSCPERLMRHALSTPELAQHMAGPVTTSNPGPTAA